MDNLLNVQFVYRLLQRANDELRRVCVDDKHEALKERLYNLIQHTNGITRTAISHALHNNLTAKRITDALTDLQSEGKIYAKKDAGVISLTGRQAERWFISEPVPVVGLQNEPTNNQFSLTLTERV